jgi:hypothetical protein
MPDRFDIASAIVENPDGTVTLVGTRTVKGAAHCRRGQARRPA